MSDDRKTSHGTVKGHHPTPEEAVPEGGVARAPTEPGGGIKPSASKAKVEGALDGDTSTATAGSADKQHAAEIGAAKTQSGRGHRKE